MSETVSVLVDAKQEYMDTLLEYIQEPIIQHYQKLYQDALVLSKSKHKQSFRLIEFQNLCRSMKDFPIEKQNEIINKLLEQAKCKFIDDLIHAIFISYTKILVILRTKDSPMEISVPSRNVFLWNIMLECARFVWKRAFLFDNSVSSIEQQKHQVELEGLIEQGIRKAIRRMLPIEYILTESIGSYSLDRSIWQDQVEHSKPDQNIVAHDYNLRKRIDDELNSIADFKNEEEGSKFKLDIKSIQKQNNLEAINENEDEKDDEYNLEPEDFDEEISNLADVLNEYNQEKKKKEIVSIFDEDK